MAAKNELILTFSDAAEWEAWLARQPRPLGRCLAAHPQAEGERAHLRPRSRHRARAEALIASGGIKPPGLAEVERARADGRWTRAYDGARAAQVPPDLADALARNARARSFFDALDRANRYAILWRVQTAKKPETRARRIDQFVALCAAGQTLHPTPRARSRRPRD